MIAVPLCSTGLAPPAFTAPCRNQTGDSYSDNGKQCARTMSLEISSFCGRAMRTAYEIVGSLTNLLLGSPDAPLRAARPLTAPLGQHHHHIGQPGAALITLGDNRALDRPHNGERWIVPGNAEFACRIVHLRALVFDMR